MNKNISIISLAGIALLLAGCSGNKAQVQEAQERIEIVKTTVLQPRTIARNIEVSTTLMGYETQNVAPSLTGRIEHIYVEVGSKVKAGDNLVRMDQNQYNTARLTFTNLKTEMARMEKLKESGSISQQSYDQMKLSYDQARESLEFLQTNTYVKAPFKGVISAKTYEDGELYGGQPILVLTQIEKLKALVAIPERYFPKIKAGMKLYLTSDIYKDETFPASIELVYPTIDPASHTFQVKIVIPNADERLRPGMYVKTTIALGQEQIIVAPYQSVLKLTGANDRYVFLNENGIAKRVNVTMGERFDEMIEINAPEIREGVEIVSVGQSKLVDGVKLNVIKD
ncbi:MAG: efflux RND transporter periplasmic adaptor subunit [Bacteroidales bacterium]|nr:efflux RND transporter periplasmic adaptor subunit [Bacteroidales bacterium]